MMSRRSAIPSLLLLVFAASAQAQGDLEAERRSLRGVASFAVEVTIEGPRHLTDSEVVGAGSVGDRVIEQLRAAGLPVTARGGSSSYLHVHLNMMSIDTGLIPFSIELGFHQDVRLRRNSYQTTAVTWSESVLGIVSPDLVSTIIQSLDELVAQFIRDFEAAE